MTQVIDKEYLDSILDVLILAEAVAIAQALEERALAGYRYVCICKGKRRISEENTVKVIEELKKKGIELDSHGGNFNFSCPCKKADMDDPSCKTGYVFKF